MSPCDQRQNQSVLRFINRSINLSFYLSIVLSIHLSGILSFYLPQIIESVVMGHDLCCLARGPRSVKNTASLQSLQLLPAHFCLCKVARRKGKMEQPSRRARARKHRRLCFIKYLIKRSSPHLFTAIYQQMQCG